MEHEQKRSRSETFFNFIKNLFIVLLFLQFAPSIISGIKSTLVDTIAPKTHVGYLTINGPITDAAFYVKKIDDMAKDTEIKALFLRINSPGGYAGSSQAIFNEVKKFRVKKPVVALIENMGASGAYYIAAAANSIVASPMAMVGSIGVLMELPNVKDLLLSWKVQYRYVQSGTYKTAGSMVKELTKDELEYLQRMSDDNYAQFTKDVAESRKLSAKDHKRWADGQVLTGNQAFKLKLVDKLGSYNDAITEIKRLAKVPATDEIRLVPAKRPTGLARLLGSEEDEMGGDQLSAATQVAGFMGAVYHAFVTQQTTQNVQAIA
jgi:protease-4